MTRERRKEYPEETLRRRAVGQSYRDEDGQEGALVNAARGLLNIEAARESYLAESYNKALVEAQVASWDILRVPVDSTTGGRHSVPSEEYAVREHLGYPVPELTD